jgi:hypothetical protein
MLHQKTYDPFSSDVMTVPSPSYDEFAEQALRLYPGANGDKTLALTFLAFSQSRRLERAKKYYSSYHHAEDSKKYADQWVERYSEYLIEPSV